MIGDDSRGCARARGSATVHKNAMHGWGRLARARATVHKNAMIEDDARAGAHARAGVTMHKNVQKVKIGKSMIFKKKTMFLDAY